MIVKCSCTHDAQDQFLGSGNRVANECGSKVPGMMVFRCTVCKSEHTMRESDVLARVASHNAKHRRGDSGGGYKPGDVAS